MNLLIMPITGIPLPFISYGGTFMVVLLFLMGLSQSVWVHRIDPERKRVRPQLEIEHLD
jgi:rod shape determining protein RodA